VRLDKRLYGRDFYYVDLPEHVVVGAFAGVLACSASSLPGRTGTFGGDLQEERNAVETIGGNDATKRAWSPEQVAAAARGAVVEVLAGESYGSGFHVGGGAIVTNLHVVAGARQVQVRFENGTPLSVSRVHAYDVAADLAVLDCTACLKYPKLTTSTAHARPGQRIVALGNPRGLAFSVSDGIVSAVRVEAGVELLQTTAPISPGSSGGPLLDEGAEVLGVARFYLQGSQNLNFGVTARHIVRLLQDAHGGLSMGEFGIKTAVANDAEPARASTYLDSCRGLSDEACLRRCDLGDLEACETCSARFVIAGGDETRAWKLMEKACTGGRPMACLSLSSFAAGGLGIAGKNEAMAFELNQRACALWLDGCNAGVADACSSLASCLLPGGALPENASRANAYYRKACDLGSGFACWHLAGSYENGRGVPIDPAQSDALSRNAIRLWQLDCAAGKQQACGFLKVPPRR
jgi:S1-C subfamily serine protease